MWMKAVLGVSCAIRSVRKNVSIYPKYRLLLISISVYIVEDVQKSAQSRSSESGDDI